MPSQGPNNLATWSNDESIGAGSWSDSSSAASSNDSRATRTCATSPPFDTTNYLKGLNPGFAIPDGATIDGIETEWERHTDIIDSIRDFSIKLVKGGTISGDDNADTATAWPNLDTYATQGGPTDMWGLTLTETDVESTTFGMVLSAKNHSTLLSAEARVDHGRITVYYTEAAVAGVLGCAREMKRSWRPAPFAPGVPRLWEGRDGERLHIQMNQRRAA